MLERYLSCFVLLYHLFRMHNAAFICIMSRNLIRSFRISIYQCRLHLKSGFVIQTMTVDDVCNFKTVIFNLTNPLQLVINLIQFCIYIGFGFGM